MDLIIGTVAGAFALEDGETRPLIEGTRINHVADHGDGWWAVDGKRRVHQDGNVVAEAAEGVSLTSVEPAGSTVWLGGTAARLFRLDGDGLVEDLAFAEAPGRDRWYTPWGGPPDVRSMSLDREGTLYVNVHVGGILRYGRDGIEATIDQDADVHQVLAHPLRSGTVLAACAYGLAISQDGIDYEVSAEGLHAAYCRAVAVIDDTVLVSASTGPRTDRARIYRTSLDGGELEPCIDGLPEWFGDNVDTQCLAARGGVFFAGWQSSVWRSVDRGQTWSEVVHGLPLITCLA